MIDATFLMSCKEVISIGVRFEKRSLIEKENFARSGLNSEDMSLEGEINLINL